MEVSVIRSYTYCIDGMEGLYCMSALQVVVVTSVFCVFIPKAMVLSKHYIVLARD